MWAKTTVVTIFVASLYLNLSQNGDIIKLELAKKDLTGKLKKCKQGKIDDKVVCDKVKNKIKTIVKEAEHEKCKLKSISSGSFSFTL